MHWRLSHRYRKVGVGHGCAVLCCAALLLCVGVGSIVEGYAQPLSQATVTPPSPTQPAPPLPPVSNLQAVVTVLGGAIIAMVSDWQVALSALAALAVFAISGIISQRSSTLCHAKEHALVLSANHAATEALLNIRTVAAFGLQDEVEGRFAGHLAKRTTVLKEFASIAALTFALNVFCLFGAFALIFWFGAGRSGKFTYNDGLGSNTDDILRVGVPRACMGLSPLVPCMHQHARLKQRMNIHNHPRMRPCVPPHPSIPSPCPSWPGCVCYGHVSLCSRAHPGAVS
jgi:ABC-type multidrug transport system fused ATPase/permease subunit